MSGTDKAVTIILVTLILSTTLCSIAHEITESVKAGVVIADTPAENL